jgi:hypothetical protein
MADTYVIDGYNLIHALGMIQKELAAGGLEASRRQFLDFLVKGFGADAQRVTVVFDARQAPRGRARQQVHQGLHVHFAPKDQSADDWIEHLIETAPQPQSLVVISNDMRLQNAGKRRGARPWSHDDLLHFLEKRGQQPATPVNEEKRSAPTPQEVNRWLEEFGMLENDPALREFFDQDRFE